MKDTALGKAGFIYRPSRQITREAGEGQARERSPGRARLRTPLHPASGTSRGCSRPELARGVLKWHKQRRLLGQYSPPRAGPSEGDPPRASQREDRQVEKGTLLRGSLPAPPSPMTLQGPACKARCELPTPGEGGESPDPRERERHERGNRDGGPCSSKVPGVLTPNHLQGPQTSPTTQAPVPFTSSASDPLESFHFPPVCSNSLD